MARRVSHSELSPSGRHIAREYERARAKGVTQAEFARATGISSPRYLRKILSGERSGRVIEKQAARGGYATVSVRDSAGSVRSFNMRLPEGSSRLDVFRPKAQRQIRAAAKEQAQAWQDRQSGEWAGRDVARPKIAGVQSSRSIRKMPKAQLDV